MDFIKLATVSDLAGIRMKSFRLMGRIVAIVREPDGTFWATEIGCKHQNADLTTGKFDGDVVTCPRHRWQYNIRTGQCLTRSLRRCGGTISNGWAMNCTFRCSRSKTRRIRVRTIRCPKSSLSRRPRAEHVQAFQYRSSSRSGGEEILRVTRTSSRNSRIPAIPTSGTVNNPGK